MGEPLSARIERKNEKKGFHKKPSQPNECMEGKREGEEKRGLGRPKKSRNRKSLLLARKRRFSNSHAPFPLLVSPVPFAAQTVLNFHLPLPTHVASKKS